MFYSEEIIEEVARNNEIVDLIGDYVHLNKKGNSYFGLCPFHNEKTPSFSVSREKQMFYCFGCGKGGNVYSFLMDYENYSFVEAVKFLAKRANIDLPEPEVSEEVADRMRHKERLYEINNRAARYYYGVLKSQYGQNATQYLTDRGIQPEVVKKFGLGYATMFRNNLKNYLQENGYQESDIADAGLLIVNKDKPSYDRFFNRIMFPIFDVHGRVIGFGGRVMGDGLPKYLNTNETQIFDKSRNLYGLNLAKRSRQPFLILVEGYIDVIALHQAGIDNAVASLGTALTGGHSNLLKRYVDEVIIAYDADQAGIAATLRAIPILKSAGLRVRVLAMEEAKDPDEFIKQKGVDAFKELLQRSMPGFMFEVQQLSKQYQLTDPEYKTVFVREVAKKLLLIEEKLELDNYLEAVVREYQLSKEGLYELLQKQASDAGIVKERPAVEKNLPERKEGDGLKNAQIEFLSVVVTDKMIYQKVQPFLQPKHFRDEIYQIVCQYVYDQYEKDVEIKPNHLLNKLIEPKQQQEVTRIFSQKIKIENQNQLENLLNDNIKLIKTAYLEEQQKNIVEATDVNRLLEEKKQLMRLFIRLDEETYSN